ncbi:MAG: metallophosphoesterase [Eubacterium sp.]
MKILIIADVHNRPLTSKRARIKTLNGIKKAITDNPCDLIVFLGDIVHGPDFKTIKRPYEKYLREVLDLTGEVPFATIFGNHDDECAVTKDEILRIIDSYPNSLTNGRNYVVDMKGETLLFIDSGSYYEGEGSYYDVVKQDVIDWAKDKTEGKKAILFQHIIVPDIIDCLDEYKYFKPFCVTGDKKWVKFKKGISYTGHMGERPCPPKINTGELKQLSPYLKGAVFGHDHKNDFELNIFGVKIIQCAGSGSNSYDKFNRSSVKLLDTKTMQTKKIFI